MEYAGANPAASTKYLKKMNDFAGGFAAGVAFLGLIFVAILNLYPLNTTVCDKIEEGLVSKEYVLDTISCDKYGNPTKIEIVKNDTLKNKYQHENF